MKINLSKEWLARQAEREENVITNEKATEAEEAATPILSSDPNWHIEDAMPWMIDALDHLLHKRDYDGPKHEEYLWAMRSGQRWVNEHADQLTQAIKERDEAVKREEKYKAALEQIVGVVRYREYDQINEMRNIAAIALSEGKEK